MQSKLSLLLRISFQHCMDPQPHSHDRFSKISRTLCTTRNQYIIVVFLQCTQKDKLPFVLISTLLLYIPLLALTHKRTEWQMENEYTRCTWAGGTFFPVVLLCQFLVRGDNQVLVYIIMYLEYNTVVVLCQFFGCGGKQFLGLRTYLVYDTVVLLCQFFGCGGKQLSK